MFTRIALTAFLAAATLFGVAQDATAQRRQQGSRSQWNRQPGNRPQVIRPQVIRPKVNRPQDVRIGIGPIRIEIGDGWTPPGPGPVRPVIEYVVTEFNPITGGVYRTRTFSRQADANAYKDSVSRVHWVQWRFVGINEPLRSRRFSSSTAAQRFIDTDGPSRSGAAGFAILTHETSIEPARVRVAARQVQN
jgi:hypothetical protein